MGDMADDYEYHEMNRSRRAEPALKKLADWCQSSFPYVCSGKKTISDDGREVLCECGTGCRNKAEF